MQISAVVELGTVGVRELRQNLSVYLERVKRGETLVVTERRQEVAILKPIGPRDRLVERLVAEGRATPARRSSRRMPAAIKARLATPLSHLLDSTRDDIV
jgi:prevent-host-death family protein